MPLIALALASASSLHAAVDPPANPQLHVENRVLLGSNESTSTTKNIIGKANGTVSINVEVDTGDEEDFDVNSLLSQLGNAKGDMKIVIVGPDGKKQVIERELTGIDTLVDQIDVGALLERIDLNALMQQARGDEHGNHDHGHGGHHGEVHIEVMTQDGDRSMQHVMAGDMEHPIVGQWSTRPPQHGDDRDMLFHSGNGDEAWFVVANIDSDMGMHERGRHEPNIDSRVNDQWRQMTDRVKDQWQQMAERVDRNFNGVQNRHGNEHAHDDRRGEHWGPNEHPRQGHTSQGQIGHSRPGDEHRDMDMHRMHEQMMNRDDHGEDHDMDMRRMHEQMMNRDYHGEDHDMDMRRMHEQMMNRDDHGEGHDDDPERFFRASESFIEQLHHARAVAKQLNNGEATALLAIWYASEHMEPNQCLELMDNIMNDDTLMPTVRRAAAFTGVQLAMESGDEHLAGRILGSIVRGAGMKNEARRNREHATETDRAPNGQRDRSPCVGRGRPGRWS